MVSLSTLFDVSSDPKRSRMMTTSTFHCTTMSIQAKLWSLNAWTKPNCLYNSHLKVLNVQQITMTYIDKITKTYNVPCVIPAIPESTFDVKFKIVPNDSVSGGTTYRMSGDFPLQIRVLIDKYAFK